MTRTHDSTLELKLVQRLIDIGIALSAETNLERLLERIVTEARSLTHAEGGSLYIREGENLRFWVSQNDRLDSHQSHLTDKIFKPFLLPLRDNYRPSIASYVAMTGTTLNLPDAYAIAPDAPYQFNADFDRKNDYYTHSILTVPLKEPSGKTIGALQLINCLRWHIEGAEGIMQPFSDLSARLAESLASQAAVAFSNVKLANELKDAYYDTISRLSVAAEYRDPETSNHLKRMSNYSRIIAKHMGMSEAEQNAILLASPMHDVGKIGISDAILLKPGRYSPEEREIMKAHPRIGADILGGSDSALLQRSATIALTHHEKYDGTGYPNGIKGDNIPLDGRIVALADVFDALASRRPYKEAWDLEEILALIRRDTGTHFDPKVVAAFEAGIDEIIEIYHRYQDEPEST
ncbi:MAG: HD domain-containing phosphohydrolase [Cyanobacteria bacterium J06642_2]